MIEPTGQRDGPGQSLAQPQQPEQQSDCREFLMRPVFLTRPAECMAVRMEAGRPKGLGARGRRKVYPPVRQPAPQSKCHERDI